MKIVVLVVAAFVLSFWQGTASAAPLKVDRLAVEASKSGWVAKETSVSKLTDAEKKKRLGLKKYGKTMPRTPIAPRRLSRSLPASYDWRTQGMVTPVRDQGNCGSCWAFSAVGTAESAYKIRDKSTADLDLSEQVVVSCDSGNEGCNGGYMDVVSDFLVNSGTGAESCYPYTGTNGSCSKSCADRSAYKVLSWGYVSSVKPDLNSIKAALVEYGPLVTTMMVYSDFMYYAGGVYKYTSGGLEGGHAIILFGYDDATQSFSVKNSWGTGWGEDGTFRIAYSELSSRVLFGEETIYYTVGAAPPPPLCTITFSAPGAKFASAGGKGSFVVSTSDKDCAWKASVNVPWITLAISGGTGTLPLDYVVAQNTDTNDRSGLITVSGNVFTVTQSAATPGCNTSGGAKSGGNATKSWIKFW